MSRPKLPVGVVKLKVGEVTFRLLSTLGEPEHVILQLIDHAAQGVYRPGSWERPWLIQAFGDEFVEKLEPGDPYGRSDDDGGLMFQRPRARSRR